MRRRSASRGQALTEFAVSGMLMLILLAGIAQLGVIYYDQLSADSGSREGVRVAAAKPGDAGLFSGVNSPASPGTHTCSGPADPILACQAVYNSTRSGALGGLITPANFTVKLTGSTFPGSSPTKCPGNTGSSDGMVTVSVNYNAPIFVPLVDNLLSTGGNAFRTLNSTVKIRVEPCINTNGG